MELQEAGIRVVMADISRGVAFFDRYDVDHSGTIGSSEFKQMMQGASPVAAHSLSATRIQRFMAHMDRDGNGVLEPMSSSVLSLTASAPARNRASLRRAAHAPQALRDAPHYHPVRRQLAGQGTAMGKPFRPASDIMMQRIRKAVDQLFSAMMPTVAGLSTSRSSPCLSRTPCAATGNPFRPH